MGGDKEKKDRDDDVDRLLDAAEIEQDEAADHYQLHPELPPNEFRRHDIEKLVNA
jgi:hypothetical protein